MDIRPGNAWWQGRREEQQDAFGFAGFDDDLLRAHGGVLMVLADGMGGMSSGREASRIAVEHFMAAYRQKLPREAIPTALQRSLAVANQAVYELALAREGEGEVGTTLVAAVVHEGAAHWIGVGDSRLYLYQADCDTLTLCTEDHTQGNALMEEVARGELTRAAAEADPDFHALVSFLGLREIPKVDRSVRPLPLGAGDRLLLVSDGVSGTLAESDIGMLLRGQEAQPAAEALITAVKDRAGSAQDNATATVIAFGEALAATRIARPGAAAPAEPTTRRPAVANARPRRRLGKGLLRGLAALALVLLGIGIGTYVTRDKPEPAAETPAADTANPALVPDPSRETFYFDDPPAGEDEGDGEQDGELPAPGDEPPEEGTEPPQPPAEPVAPGGAPADPQRTPQPPVKQGEQPAAQPAPGTPDTKPKAPPAPTKPTASPGERGLAPVEERRAPGTEGSPPAGSAPAAEPEPKPGFFKRWFGGGKGDKEDGEGSAGPERGGAGSDPRDSPFLQTD